MKFAKHCVDFAVDRFTARPHVGPAFFNCEQFGTVSIPAP
jgi:hypothetical protein